MPKTILRQETVNGVTFNVIQDTDTTVYKGPAWMLAGILFIHTSKPWLALEALLDPEGQYIFGESVLRSPDWQYLMAEDQESPGGEVRTFEAWLEPTPHVYREEVTVQPQPMEAPEPPKRTRKKPTP